MTGPPLSDRWNTYLTERGVTPEIARQRGYIETLAGKPLDGSFSSAYGFPQKASGLLIPLHPLLGGDAYQLRLDNPELFKENKGKARKFLAPAKQANVPGDGTEHEALIGRIWTADSLGRGRYSCGRPRPL